MFYSHNDKTNIHIFISGNIIKDNDDFNERTNTLLYKNMYLSHFFSKVLMVLLCVRDELETGTDCYIDPTFSPDHSNTSSILAGAAQPESQN